MTSAPVRPNPKASAPGNEVSGGRPPRLGSTGPSPFSTGAKSSEAFLLELQRVAGNKAVQTLFGGRAPVHAGRPTVQRGGLTDEDVEVIGEGLGRAAIGFWNFLTSLFRRPASGAANPPPLTEEDDSSASEIGDEPSVDESSGEQSGTDETGPPGELALVPSQPQRQHFVLTYPDWEAIMRPIVRMDLEQNARLVRTFQQLTAHLGVATYSPDLAAAKQKHEAEMELAQQTRAAERERERQQREELKRIAEETLRRLLACQSIHTTFATNLKRDMAITDARAAAGSLKTFISANNLGSELAQLAERIWVGLIDLNFKRFKLSEQALQAIAGADSLLSALEIMRSAVDVKLQEQARTSSGQKKPSVHELRTAERFEKRKLKEVTTAESGDITDEEDTPEEISPTRPPLPGFVKLGQAYGGLQVFGRIDWHVIEGVQHHAVRTMKDSGIDYRTAYQKAMTNMLAGAGDIGNDCTKPEGNKQWVVKISWQTADILRLDNKLSPLADEVRDTDQNTLHLTFDKIVFRH